MATEETPKAVREKVAEAIYAAMNGGYPKAYPWREMDGEMVRDLYRAKADAALGDLIEPARETEEAREAGRVGETRGQFERDPYEHVGSDPLARALATAIPSLHVTEQHATDLRAILALGGLHVAPSPRTERGERAPRTSNDLRLSEALRDIESIIKHAEADERERGFVEAARYHLLATHARRLLAEFVAAPAPGGEGEAGEGVLRKRSLHGLDAADIDVIYSMVAGQGMGYETTVNRMGHGVLSRAFQNLHAALPRDMPAPGRIRAALRAESIWSVARHPDDPDLRLTARGQSPEAARTQGSAAIVAPEREAGDTGSPRSSIFEPEESIEPSGHCITHGEYFTDDCLRCHPPTRNQENR